MASELSPMQKELLQRADSIFASVGEAVTKATNFAAEQIPDIAIQYVTFGRAQFTIYVVIFAFIFLLGLFSLIGMCYFNLGKFEGFSGDNARFLFMMAGIVMGVIGVIGVGTNLTQFLMVWFAPKIWLIQNLVLLIKGST